MLPFYMKIKTVENDIITGSPDFNLLKKYYENKAENIINSHRKIRDNANYIWSILTSARFSMYSGKMDEQICNQYKGYISQCLESQSAIHIVLAGFPGKCANFHKVKNRMPDLGELAVLCQLHLLNSLIKYRHPQGIKVSFMSDYSGLGLTFFPDMGEVEQYVNMLRTWIKLLQLEVEIVYVTEMLPEIRKFQLEFCHLRVPELARTYETMYDLTQLEKSIADNINIHKARQYYREEFHSNYSDIQIYKIAGEYYESFWHFFASQNAVNNYFGNVIYASPVAYHPDRRLCLRLQSRNAKVASWNGCGVAGDKEIYSLDQRVCEKSGYKAIIDENHYFWGYFKSIPGV